MVLPMRTENEDIFVNFAKFQGRGNRSDEGPDRLCHVVDPVVLGLRGTPNLLVYLPQCRSFRRSLELRVGGELML